MKYCFSSLQQLFLGSGLLCLFLSTYFNSFDQNKKSLVFIGLAAICLFTFSITLDPFLNLWDERFHALVAKNLMHHPLMPTLYEDPVVDMDYDRWDRFHIWLHKQPLFLWQIVLSYKIFGISEISLRIPMVVLGTILVLIGYRTGTLLVNKNVGFYTGILIFSNFYFLELIAGRQELESNDFSFLVYISLSIWSFVEYYFSGKRYWVILIGLFSGMAILCKWLAGLLVYFGWFVLKIQNKQYLPKYYTDVLLALLVTFIVFIPWQVLTYIWYPAESALTYQYNLYHLIKPLEGHRGDIWYHFNQFGIIYGSLSTFLIIPALVVLSKQAKNKQLFYSLLSMLIITYLFFTISKTKMPSFTIIASLIVLIAFAALFDLIIETLIKNISKTWLQKIFIITAVCTYAILSLDLNTIKEKHSLCNKENDYSVMLIHNKKVFTTLQLPKNAVIFNVKGRHYIECMFYTGCPAYNFIPSEEQVSQVKSRNRSIVIFRPVQGELPSYIAGDSAIILLNDTIQGYD